MQPALGVFYLLFFALALVLFAVVQMQIISPWYVAMSPLSWRYTGMPRQCPKDLRPEASGRPVSCLHCQQLPCAIGGHLDSACVYKAAVWILCPLRRDVQAVDVLLLFPCVTILWRLVSDVDRWGVRSCVCLRSFLCHALLSF